MPPGPPGNNPVNRPTSSSSTPGPGPLSGALGRHPNSLPTQGFLPPAEARKTNGPRIVDLPSLPEIPYDKYDVDDERNDSSDLGGAEGKPPVSLKQTEFSVKQFVKRMRQANYKVCNKWKKVWVAGIVKKLHRSIIRGQNHLPQLRDGPLHCETGVADFLETFESWLPLDNFDNAEWIRRQWVEMILTTCASEIREARIRGRQGDKQPATDLGYRASKEVRSYLRELPNTTFMVVICRVSNGTDIVPSPNQLEAAYTDVRH